MIVIIDYGMGNLRSVEKALQKAGAETRVSQRAEDIEKAQKIVLPGVGAMQPAMERLTSLHLIMPIKKAVSENKPFLGICLGLQLLFEESTEGGRVKGLGLLNGNVERLSALKVPHMGWNQLKIQNRACPLFQGIAPSTHVYFCHSYFVRPSDPALVVTTTDYGIEFTSAVFQRNIFGVQFHPEKSQAVGLQILKNFNDL